MKTIKKVVSSVVTVALMIQLICGLYVFAANEEIIVNVNDNEFSQSGWTESSLDGYNGVKTYYTMTEDRVASYTPQLPVSGIYEVFVYKIATAGANPQTYQVNHNGMNDSVALNFSGTNEGWMALGKYDFAANGTEKVEISSVNRQITRISAVKFVLIEEKEVFPTLIIDTENTNHYYEKGLWAEPYKTGNYGSSLTRYAADYDNNSGAEAYWTPNYDEPKLVNIKVWINSASSCEQTYEIHHDGKISYQRINSDNGGGWISLGYFNFTSSNDYLKLSGKNISADAVAFEELTQEKLDTYTLPEFIKINSVNDIIPALEPDKFNYDVTLPYKKVKVTINSVNENINIKVNGIQLINGIQSDEIILNEGTNEIKIELSAGDNASTYLINAFIPEIAAVDNSFKYDNSVSDTLIAGELVNSVTAVNNSNLEKDLSLATALYNGDELKSLIFNTKKLGAETTQEFENSIIVPDDNLKDYSVKTFMWDGLTPVSCTKKIVPEYTDEEITDFEPGDFYVSTVGNDNWSGTLAEPNADGTDGPFATVERARDAVREINKTTDRDIYVYIRGGDYTLHNTVVFDEQDSHHDSYRIIYSAYPGEKPVFNSDYEITGWKIAQNVEGLPDSVIGKVYEADLPKLPNNKNTFYTMYENGTLLTCAQSEGLVPTKKVPGNPGDGGGVQMDATATSDRNSIYFPKGTIKNWSNLNDIEIFVQPGVGYVTNYLPLQSVDTSNNVATTAVKSTYSMDPAAIMAIDSGCFRVENAIDYLDTVGEWVVNTQTKKIYYYPRNNNIGKITIPLLTEYFLVDANSDKASNPLEECVSDDEIIRNIEFRGLTFTRGERYNVTDEDNGCQHEWEYWDKNNAVLRFRNTDSCVVDECRFTNTGGVGVRLDLYSQNNTVKNCLFDYLGGTGLFIGGYGPGTLDVSKNNKVTNNEFHHVGQFYYQSNAIMLYQSGENEITNNLIHHIPYDAIALTGVRPGFFNLESGALREQTRLIRRSELDPDSYNLGYFTMDTQVEQWPKIWKYYHTKDNLVQDNEIFLAMQKLFDGNGIYLSDVGSNNVVKRNYIHHFVGKGMQQAIRTDAFIKDTQIEQNIIWACNGGGINIKYYENNVYNNIIANIMLPDGVPYIGHISMYEVWNKSKMPEGAGVYVQNNIFYKTLSNETFYRANNINVENSDTDYNLYYDTGLSDHGAAQLNVLKNTKGIDKNSIIGDPMFRDIENGDFRLNENSPAYSIGFKDIETENIGLTSEFPQEYKEVVKSQLGKYYNDFKHLELMK